MAKLFLKDLQPEQFVGLSELFVAYYEQSTCGGVITTLEATAFKSPYYTWVTSMKEYKVLCAIFQDLDKITNLITSDFCTPYGKECSAALEPILNELKQSSIKHETHLFKEWLSSLDTNTHYKRFKDKIENKDYFIDSKIVHVPKHLK